MTTSIDRTAEGWTNVARRYDEAIFPFTSQYAADALRALRVQKGEAVLDVAAGSGAFTLLAARAGARVTATDFSPEMIGLLEARLRREGVTGAHAAVMDGQALTLPDASFDAAASVFGLIFFPDRVKGFRELHRVLRPGGRVAVTSWRSPEHAPFLVLIRPAAARAGVELRPPASTPPVFSLQDEKQLEAEMMAGGFRDVKVQELSHTWDVAKPEDYFGSLEGTSPVFRPTLDEIGPERLPAVKAALVDLVREKYGSGPVRIPAKAWLATGVR